MSCDFAFLDSGTGGIPYMLHLKKMCPASRCVYLADGAHFPYGEKSTDEINTCAVAAVELIQKKWQPRIIVVACNTMSVTALETLRSRFPETPFVGTVPAVKLAAAVTENNTIGLLATNATIHHPYVQKLKNNFADNCTLVTRGDASLVSFVEHDLFTATENEKKEAIQPAVDFFAREGCDTIILGCTHFLHLADNIARLAGPAVHVVDSRDGVARQAIRLLSNTPSEQKLNGSETDVPDCSLYVTGFTQTGDNHEYQVLCKNFTIPWGGIIKPLQA